MIAFKGNYAVDGVGKTGVCKHSLQEYHNHGLTCLASHVSILFEQSLPYVE
jgi:hypothetical protein